MDCRKCGPLLEAYLEGELREEERLELEKHIGSCEVCRKELEETRKVIEMMSSLDPVAAPKDFLQGVRARIDTGQSVWEKLRLMWARPLRLSHSFGVLTIIAVFIGIFVWMSIRPLIENNDETVSVPESPRKEDVAINKGHDRETQWNWDEGFADDKNAEVASSSMNEKARTQSWSMQRTGPAETEETGLRETKDIALLGTTHEPGVVRGKGTGSGGGTTYDYAVEGDGRVGTLAKKVVTTPSEDETEEEETFASTGAGRYAMDDSADSARTEAEVKADSPGVSASKYFEDGDDELVVADEVPVDMRNEPTIADMSMTKEEKMLGDDREMEDASEGVGGAGRGDSGISLTFGGKTDAGKSGNTTVSRVRMKSYEADLVEIRKAVAKHKGTFVGERKLEAESEESGGKYVVVKVNRENLGKLRSDLAEINKEKAASGEATKSFAKTLPEKVITVIIQIINPE